MSVSKFSKDHKTLYEYLDTGGAAILFYSDMKKDPPHRLVMLNVPDMNSYWLEFISEGWSGFRAKCERMNIQWAPVELLAE